MSILKVLRFIGLLLMTVSAFHIAGWWGYFFVIGIMIFVQASVEEYYYD